MNSQRLNILPATRREIMNNLVNEFKRARESLIRTIEEFPKEKRELILFDKWSLKNILSHLSGWAKYQRDSLRLFKKGREPQFPENLKASINEDFVLQRDKWSWNRVYQEFLRLSEELIKEYKDLPGELWEKMMDKEQKITPKEFIKIEINHYRKTHGPQVKKVLKK